MAYLQAGLTNDELAERFHSSETQALSQQEVVARFGRPRHPSRQDLAPYAFLEPDPFSPNAIRPYHDLKAADWMDDNGRRYYRFGAKTPRTVYVALPVGETMRERKEKVSALKRQDFPRPGEQITLRNASQELLKARVAHIDFQRTATAVLTLDSDLPLEHLAHPALDSERTKLRIERNVDRLRTEARERGAPDNAVVVYSRAPRVATLAKRHGSSIAAPKAPKAPR
jgi:hypothetical protein